MVIWEVGMFASPYEDAFTQTASFPGDIEGELGRNLFIAAQALQHCQAGDVEMLALAKIRALPSKDSALLDCGDCYLTSIGVIDVGHTRDVLASVPDSRPLLAVVINSATIRCPVRSLESPRP
jgi:hypothetical protein